MYGVFNEKNHIIVEIRVIVTQVRFAQDKKSSLVELRMLDSFAEVDRVATGHTGARRLPRRYKGAIPEGAMRSRASDTHSSSIAFAFAFAFSVNSVYMNSRFRDHR